MGSELDCIGWAVPLVAEKQKFHRSNSMGWNAALCENPGLNTNSQHRNRKFGNGQGREAGRPGAAAQSESGLLWTETLWPSGLRRWLKAPFRKGVGSNPTGVIFEGWIVCIDFASYGYP